VLPVSEILNNHEPISRKHQKIVLAVMLVLSLVRYHRTELEIICDILELCLNGANKHRIIYEAELNTGILNKYLDILLSSGLVTVRVAYSARNTPAVKAVYETTEAGMSFLEVCMNMLNKLGKVRKSKFRVKAFEKTWILE